MSNLVPNYEPLRSTKNWNSISPCFLRSFIFKVAVKHWLDLATDEHGCLCLNECIDFSKFEFRDALLKVIAENSEFLSQDPFGLSIKNKKLINSKKVLSLQHPKFIEIICNCQKGIYVPLSMQKCSNHIVEKCIKSLWIGFVINDLVKSGKLEQVARDQYGN
ncbi:pumilio homolog 12-like [Tasmannia lanceolata]|uniref:pumilio homolog 12-like n=1 Tax=Tasmannia lanceolata TaxID=3420 RepID=UPI004062C0E0